uniref:T-complex protein 1 subunit theta n=1 Tax=Brassica campestris TaxID=3711 RepID=M4F2X3_BRACM
MQLYGIQSMLKEGYRHQAVIKNIKACKELSTITRTSLGPNDKLFVTNDAATIVNELEIQHPAAKILVLAAKALQEEIGDGATLTISFAGELLQNTDCGGAYQDGVVEVLEELVESGSERMDVHSKDEVVSRMRAAVASKQFGQEEIICSLVADACIQVCPKNPTNFNVGNVRVAKLLAGGLHNSCIVRGMVLESDAVGSIKRMVKAKVALFAGGGVDTTATETK